MTKCAKFELILLENQSIKYKDFIKLIKNMKNDITIIKNKTIWGNYEFDNFTDDYIKKYNTKPEIGDILSYKMVSGYINNQLKSDYPEMYSSNLSQSIQDACKRYKNDLKDFKKGERSITSYKEQPIDLHNKSIIITYDVKTKRYIANIKLFSRGYAKNLGLQGCGLDFRLSTENNKYLIKILQNIVNGNYKICGSKLELKSKRINNKNGLKCYLFLSYSFKSVSTLDLDKNNIMGIDLGITMPAAMWYSNEPRSSAAYKVPKHYDEYIIDGGETKRVRSQIFNRKQKMQRICKYRGDGSLNHGTKTKTNPVTKLNQKWSDFRKTQNYKFAKQIVNNAIKHNCGTIQMEDLKGVTRDTDKTFLYNWTFFDLQQKIINKAAEYGIEVKKINRVYTSQRCPVCGCIHHDNRLVQSVFKCVNCGHTDNADLNAAKNICDKDIEKKIKDSHCYKAGEKIDKSLSMII